MARSALPAVAVLSHHGTWSWSRWRCTRTPPLELARARPLAADLEARAELDGTARTIPSSKWKLQVRSAARFEKSLRARADDALDMPIFNVTESIPRETMLGRRPGASPLGRRAGARKRGRTGAPKPQAGRQAKRLPACATTLSMVPRDCSHRPIECGRIQLLILATADMVGQPAYLSRAVRSRGAPSQICGKMNVKLIGTV